MPGGTGVGAGVGRGPASGSCSSPRPGPASAVSMVVSEVRMPCAERRAALGLEPVDGGEHQRLVVGRHLDREAAVAERHDADQSSRPAGVRRTPRAAALAASIRVGARSVGGHAARDVEGEDDRALDARHADDALRPGDGQDQDRQPGDEQHGREHGGAGGRQARTRPRARAPRRRPPNPAIRRRRRRSRTR